MSNSSSKLKHCVHKDHRQRLRARFLKEGLDGFQPHEVLELLLFYSIPQQNTNPIGHELMNSFGSISSVFDADFKKLIEVNGVKEYSATLIKLIPELCSYYQSDKNKPGEKYTQLDEIAKFCLSKYMALSEERLSVVMFDGSSCLLGMETLSVGSTTEVQLSIECLAALLFKHGCCDFILVHNHPNGDLRPSSEDLCLTKKVELSMRLINKHLAEHILIAGSNYLPIMELPEYINAKDISLRDLGVI